MNETIMMCVCDWVHCAHEATCM